VSSDMVRVHHVTRHNMPIHNITRRDLIPALKGQTLKLAVSVLLERPKDTRAFPTSVVSAI
jgi:hypothetical protein